MGFFPESEAIAGPRIPTGGLPEPSTTSEPTWRETFRAAAQNENIIVSTWNYLRERNGIAYDPSHDPLELVRGTKYEADLTPFVGSRSEADTRAIMARIDREEENDRILSASGAAGVVAGIGMGLLDPTIFIPGVAVSKVGRAGWTAARVGGAAAVSGAGQAALQESILNLSQETRTFEESAINVGTATVLSGILGAGIGAYLGRAETRRLQGALAADRGDVALDMEPELPPAARSEEPSAATAARLASAPGFSTSIDAVMAAAGDARSQKVFVDLGPVGAADRISAAGLDLDLSRFRHTVDNYAVRHTLKAHGDPVGEAARGQIAVTPDDLKLISDIISAPDAVRLSSTKSDIGRDILIYEKQIGEQFFYVEEVRSGRYELAMQTMYKRAGRASDDLLPTDTGVRDLTSETPSEDAVPANIAQGRFSDNMGSAGAAAAENRALELEGTFGLAGLLNQTPVVRSVFGNPLTRTFTSSLVTGRRAMADLASTALRFKGERTGEVTAPGGALDQHLALATRQARGTIGRELDRLFTQHLKGQSDAGFVASQAAKFQASLDSARGRLAPDKMTNQQFREEIGKAMRRGDQHAIPEVAEAAQFVRKNLFEPWKERAIKAGLLPEGVDVTTAESYFTRSYNKTKISAQRPQFQERITGWLESEQIDKAARKERIRAYADQLDEIGDDPVRSVEAADLVRKIEEEIAGWRGKSALEAQRQIEARVGEGEPSVAPTKALTRAVSRILASDQDLTRQELSSRAGEIVDRILGTPDGRLSYDAGSGGPRIGATGDQPPQRGALAAREFMIPDELIEEWLDSDVEAVMDGFLRSVVPDVMLTEKFGDAEMTPVFKVLREEHEAKANAAKTEKQRLKLRAEYEQVVGDLAAVRDRIRNVYGFDPRMRNVGRVAQGLKKYNAITLLGGQTVNSLADLGGTIFMHGFTRTFGDAYRPFFKGLTGMSDGFSQAKQQYRAMGVANELWTNARAREAFDLNDVYRPESRLERGLGAASDAFQVANLSAPFTDWAKTIASIVSGNSLFHAARSVADGTASPRMIARLAESGIDQHTAARIWRQFEKGGSVEDGVYLPNTADWTDGGARSAFEAAILREVDIAVITPGQERPLWLSNPILGLLGQFKSFPAAATERMLLRNIQRADARTLQGLLAGVSAGMVSYALYQSFAGKELSDDPSHWVREGVARSGVLAWFEEANTLAAKVTRGQADLYRLVGSSEPISKYQSRTALSQLLGPTAGKLETAFSVTGDFATGEVTDATFRNLRRLTAFQNLFYVRRLLDEIDGTAN